MRDSLFGKDSENLGKRVKLSQEKEPSTSRPSGDQNVFSERRLDAILAHNVEMDSTGTPNGKVASGMDPLTNATTAHKSGDAVYINVKDVLRLISSVIECFNEPNKDALANGLRRMELIYDSDRDLIGMLESFDSLFRSPYSHFVSNTVYSIVSRTLSCKVKSCNQAKILGLAFLLEHYDPLRVFQDMVGMYSMLDTFRIGQKSFRNHVLYRSLLGVYEETFSGSLTANAYSSILDCAESIGACVPFAEFLSRNVEDFLCRNFMVVYTYSFLSKLTVDLMSIKRAGDLKDDDDLVISRIFPVLYDIKLSVPNQPEKHTAGVGPVATSMMASNEVDTIDLQVKNEYFTTHGISEICDVSTSANYRNTTPEESVASGSEEMLRTLFRSDSISSIILSVYKRLFNYFLFRNKRMLANTKVPKIFTKKEKNFIFKHLRSNTQSFINVFKQIDQSHILRLQSKSCVHDASFLALLRNVREDCLGSNGLLRFYSLYIDFLEFARRPIKIQMRSIEIFSVAFNSRIDKSFSRFVVFRHPVAELSSREVIQMLAHYTSLCGQSPIHDRSADDGIVDVVEAVSLVVDYPQKLLLKANIRYYNNILRILSNLSSRFSPGLICRIIPILRQLIFCGDYALDSGRLYERLYKKFRFQDGLFTADAFSSHKLVLMAKGSTNHPTFESSFASVIDSMHSGNCNLLAEGVVDNALIFYSYYSPSFALKHQDILQRALKKNNRSTLYFLEYLREHLAGSVAHLLGAPSTDPAVGLVGECEELFTFMANNMKCLYDLYNNDVLFCDDGGPQPFGNRACISAGGNPFIGPILGIFLDSLRIKAVLPHMVIPYLMPRADCSYLYRNYIDSCVNCINDALYLIASRIRTLLMYCGTANDSLQNGRPNTTNEDEFCATNDSKDGHDVSENSLSELFERELSVMFLHSICKHSSLKRVVDKIGHQEDLLIVFIILRNLRPFPKGDRETFIRHVEEKVSDEKVFDLLRRSKDFYKKSPRGTLPVHLIV